MNMNNKIRTLIISHHQERKEKTKTKSADKME